MKAKTLNSEIIYTCAALFVANIILATLFALNGNYIVTILFTSFAVVFGLVVIEEIKPALQVITRFAKSKTKKRVKTMYYNALYIIVLPLWPIMFVISPDIYVKIEKEIK